MRAVLTGALLAASLLTPAAAHATEDRRPCVAKAEFYAVNGFDPQTRTAIEARWDVTGRGVVLPRYDAPLTYVVRYTACGYSLDDARVLVRYRKSDGQAIAAQRDVEHGAKPTGHPRR